MELQPIIDDVREHLVRAAEAGDSESGIVADRMTANIDSAVRLALLEAISAAADEITLDLAPGSVEVRLRGRDPEFAVTIPTDDAPPPSLAVHDAQPTHPGIHDAPATPPGSDEGGAARITLRLPEALKTRVESAASRDSLSVNAWLVRTLTTATAGAAQPRSAGASSGQSFTGWVR
jgi:hypothetical protein